MEFIGLDVINFPVPSDTSQAAPQIGVLSPLPILRLSPASRKGLVERMLCQVRDGRSPNSAREKEDLGKYFAFRILESRRSGLDVILQACLVRRAILKLSRSRNPIPPSIFVRQRRAHYIQGIHFECLDPHQNLRMIFSASSRIVCGSLKHDIIYVGMACNTDLIRISLPAIERCFSFHPLTRDHSLSFKYVNTSTFDLPFCAGNARYCSNWGTTWNGKICVIAAATSGLIFGLNTIVHFSMFIICHETAAYLFKMDRTTSASWILA